MNQLQSPQPVPRISVIIPAYNEERYLGDTLDSVKEAIEEYCRDHQAGVEVIVVNNNSSDRTEDVARAHLVTLVFEEKNQISAARNAGAKAAHGEILVFLDADDHLSPNFLGLVDQAMRSGGYIGGGARILWNKQSIWIAFFNGVGNCLRQLLGVSNAVPFTSKESCEKIGGFDERYYAGEDMKFAVDLKKLGKKEAKKFCVIKDGYVLKSARKFDRYGGLVVMLGFFVFLCSPWLVRSKQACFFWYSAKNRSAR
jgi:glycosyltransferase involved in cell wall biosynthesis